MFDGLAFHPFRFAMPAAIISLLFTAVEAAVGESEAAAGAKSHPVCDLAQEMKGGHQVEILLGGWNRPIYRDGHYESLVAGPVLRLDQSGRVSGQMVGDGFDGTRRIDIGCPRFTFPLPEGKSTCCESMCVWFHGALKDIETATGL